MNPAMHREQVRVGAREAAGELALPPEASGLVVFAHGNGRPTRRNAFVAEIFHRHGLATLLFDLPGADKAGQSPKSFDIDLLARHVGDALDWAVQHVATARLPLGLFGADTGVAAALRAAAGRGGCVCAVVSRGGRPDDAGAAALARVSAPTLLIVAGDDSGAVARSREAIRQLSGPKRLEVVPGASHLFAEPATLDAAANLAGAWFAKHIAFPRAA